jgi:hypothetical protein
MLLGMVDIDVVKRKPIAINFRAKDGQLDTYLMQPPKAALSISLSERANAAVASGDVKAMMGEIEDWFAGGLGKKQYKRLNDRLYDPQDPLDIVHLIKAMEGVVEEVTEDPTSSPSD